jgi:hypothetical protein
MASTIALSGLLVTMVLTQTAGKNSALGSEMKWQFEEDVFVKVPFVF